MPSKRAKKRQDPPKKVEALQSTVHTYFTRRSSSSTRTQATSMASSKAGNASTSLAEQTADKPITLTEVRELIVEFSDKLISRLDNLESKVEVNFKNFESKIDELTVKFQKSVDKICELESNVKDSIRDFEKSLEFQSQRCDEIRDKVQSESIHTKETVDKLLKTIDKLETRVKSLEDNSSYQEYRSRRYNLLIYGIPQSKNEDTEAVFRKFCSKDLKMDEETIDEILLSNCHRVPRNPENHYKAEAPNAILVKFVCISDRNLVLSYARNLTRESHMTVRTDLPNELKVKRAALSRKAYKLRRENKLKTRLRENSKQVWLEVRDDHSQPWRKFVD